MSEEPGHLFCPVAPLQIYLSNNLAGAKAVYLQPGRTTAVTGSFWYATIPLGVNQLSQMLPRMYKESGTCTSYSNHGLRATAVQEAPDAGQEIMAESGHR